MKSRRLITGKKIAHKNVKTPEGLIESVKSVLDLAKKLNDRCYHHDMIGKNVLNPSLEINGWNIIR